MFQGQVNTKGARAIYSDEDPFAILEDEVGNMVSFSKHGIQMNYTVKARAACTNFV